MDNHTNRDKTFKSKLNYKLLMIMQNNIGVNNSQKQRRPIGLIESTDICTITLNLKPWEFIRPLDYNSS